LNAGTLGGKTGSGDITLSGIGTVNVTGHIMTGTHLTAGGNGGSTTLDVFGTIDNGVVLAIATSGASNLKNDGTATSTAAISNNSTNQTLTIGSLGALTINAAESITSGTISMAGGTLTDSSGLTVGSGETLNGPGTVAAHRLISSHSREPFAN
jgi:hypothetical protein